MGTVCIQNFSCLNFHGFYFRVSVVGRENRENLDLMKISRCTVVATWLVDNYIQFLAVDVHLLSQLTWNFYERRHYGWQNSRRLTSLERQMVNSQVPEIARYLRIYSHVSFHRSNVK